MTKRIQKKEENFINKLSYKAGAAFAKAVKAKDKIDWEKVSQNSQKVIKDTGKITKEFVSDFMNVVKDLKDSFEMGLEAVQEKGEEKTKAKSAKEDQEDVEEDKKDGKEGPEIKAELTEKKRPSQSKIKTKAAASETKSSMKGKRTEQEKKDQKIEKELEKIDKEIAEV